MESQFFLLNKKFMKKIIIFDFNRTLYDPESKKLMEGARSLLKSVGKEYELYLITSKSDAKESRKKLIEKLNLQKYFEQILICKEKTKQEFRKIINKKIISKKGSFVIGDQIGREIKIGNSLGLKTIRICAGKFSDEIPKNSLEKPDFEVKRLDDISRIVL